MLVERGHVEVVTDKSLRTKLYRDDNPDVSIGVTFNGTTLVTRVKGNQYVPIWDETCQVCDPWEEPHALLFFLLPTPLTSRVLEGGM